MKVSDLSGERLDYWVAKAEGYVPEPYKSSYSIRNEKGEIVGFIGPKHDTLLWHYSPSTDWGQGGPLIEQEKIGYQPLVDGGCLAGKDSDDVDGGMFFGSGETILIAAMRCFVTSKFGEEVNE